MSRKKATPPIPAKPPTPIPSLPPHITEGDVLDFCRAHGLVFHSLECPSNFGDATKLRVATGATLNGWNQVGAIVEMSSVEKWLEEGDRKSVREKIEAGFYKTGLNYSDDKASYNADQARLNEKFKYDALRETGLDEHPKAEAAYAMAYERRHSSGYGDVLSELESLAELLLED